MGAVSFVWSSDGRDVEKEFSMIYGEGSGRLYSYAYSHQIQEQFVAGQLEFLQGILIAPGLFNKFLKES
jgi:hypothetical protein